MMEEKILSLARFVMSFQRAYIERLYGSDYLVTWDANLLHQVVGPITEAVYGAHNDYSALLCSRSKDNDIHIERDAYLPTRDNMQVFTIHYSNYDNMGEPCTSISYFHDKKRIGSCSLGSKGIHIQGPGSQSTGIKHEVKVLDNAHQAGIYRCICTTRLSVVARHGTTFDDSLNMGQTAKSSRTSENYRDILSHDQKMVVSRSQSRTWNGPCNHDVIIEDDNIATNHVTNNSLHVLTNTETTDASESKRRRTDVDPLQLERQNSVSPTIIQDHFISLHFNTMKYLECYPNVPKQIYDTYNMNRYMPQISFEDRVRQLTTGPALLCFLRRGYKVYIKQSDGNLYPCLYEMKGGNDHKLLTYGRRYPSASVCADARLLHKDRVHAPIHTSELSGNIIILTHKYKQCPTKIDAILVAPDRYNDTSPINFDMGLGEFNGSISIMGSGGSNKVLGNFAPTTKSRKNDPLIVVGMGQKRTSPINKKLDDLVANNSVRAVFLNERYYGRNTDDGCETADQPNVLRFLGYYQFDESHFVSGDNQQDVAAEFNDPSPLAWENLTFRLHPHLRIEANPFIPTLEEVHHITCQKSVDYKRIILDHDDHSDIFYNIPCIDDWRKINHTLTIIDVIEDMIKTGEINKHIEGNNVVGQK
jgi:hypothetical protein